MRLEEWIEQAGRGELARIQRATGLSYQCVHAVVHGRKPEYDTARRISEATDGAVTISELYAPRPPVRINRKRRKPKAAATPARKRRVAARRR
jgi:hypothetical protein